MNQIRPLPVLGLALALAGCISFGADPPPSLLTLTAASAVPAQTSRSAAAADAITVVPPSLPQELRTTRVPVRSGETNVAYLKNAQWVEMPGALFGRLVAETIAARTGRVVLDPSQFTFDPGVRLTGQLQAFGVDSGRMDAALVYDAVLARGPGRVETRRFEARVPIAAVDVAAAGPALNQAANQVAAEVAAWVGG
ncbi:MAG TPA: ABC-type transport auxiliary lipoprotein family protein [Allosphingosinicella sp.]|nr:ABC-type transport auxiliary lipoprotein family protein [Allosphingosinicella sp.]